jgi:hypothetical protein
MEKKYIKKIIKNLRTLENYKENSYIFKINIKNIEKI